MLYLRVWVAVATVVSSFGIVSNSFAEPGPLVVGDEYIVEVGGEVGMQALPNVRVVKPVSHGSWLVSAGNEIGISASAVRPYNPRKDACVALRTVVQSCSPNYVVRALVAPNDTDYDRLWGMKTIDAERAWGTSTGSSDTVVAIVDTGIDFNHPDLQENLWTNSGEIPGNNRDDDHNGIVDDVYGFNASTGRGSPLDDNGHGTHVAGTIGGRGNNGLGVVGVAWNPKIMALKFLNRDGSGNLAGAIAALDYLVEQKKRGVNVRVVNNSWGGGGYSQPLANAIQRVRDAGIIFVAAAGNEGNNNDETPSYPANYDFDNVVSVAAIDQNLNVASFSNVGAQAVDIAAPGVSIYSTLPGGGYGELSGTSMATPHVTGALAVLFAAEPQLSVAEALNRLYLSGSDTPTLVGLVRTMRTLNLGRMLANETAPLGELPNEFRSCSYRIATNTGVVDTRADGELPVIQADENNFQTVELPFAFPFHRTTVSTITVSPNGVVYFGSSSAGLDFRNGPKAPMNSIAALHTDLWSSGDPYGVRVKTESDAVVVAWYMHPYGIKSGWVQVRLTLHADGTIDESIGFSSALIQSVVAEQATIGLRGLGAGSAVTYAANSPLTYDGLTLRFTPDCGADSADASVQQIRLYGFDAGKKRYSSKVVPGAALKVVGRGVGSSSVSVGFLVDGMFCGGQHTVQMNQGQFLLKGRLPKRLSGVSEVTAFVGTVYDQAGVVQAKRVRGRLRQRSLGCAQLERTLRKNSNGVS